MSRDFAICSLFLLLPLKTFMEGNQYQSAHLQYFVVAALLTAPMVVSGMHDMHL